MIRICPFCQEEITPQADGTCPECGSYLLKKTRVNPDSFEEDDWTASDWGEDIEEVEVIISEM